MFLAVLDTNILASGTVTTTTPPGQIINAWRDGQFLLVTSEHILKELERTLQKPYFQAHLTKTQVNDFIKLLQSESLVTPLTVKIENVATHPEDDLIISTAISAKVDYLVTGDDQLLNKVGPIYQGLKIVTAKTFLNVLQ
jgi:putative PIN family toxin of toxin-antitoxin system